MSQVELIYDNLISKIESTLTSYTRIPNPYEPNENPSLFLRKGYGIGIGPASNTNRMVCSRLSVLRDFKVLLTNQVYATEMNSSARGSFERSLMIDACSMIKAMENENTLNGVAVRLNYSGDTGIQYVESDTEKYIFVETTFSIEYFETLNN